MDRPRLIYAAVRADLDARRKRGELPSLNNRDRDTRRRRRDLDTNAYADFAMGTMLAAAMASAGGDGMPPEQRRPSSGTALNDLVALIPDNARVLRVLHGNMDYSGSPGNFYVELVPGAFSTIPGTLVQYTPAGTRSTIDTMQLQILNDEGQPCLWLGTIDGSNQFNGYTISLDQSSGNLDVNRWVDGFATKAAQFPSLASFPCVLIATITATDVFAGTDIDGTLGSAPNLGGPGLLGFGGLVGNEQVAYFQIQNA